MLIYSKNGENVVLNCDDYYIQEEWFGADDTLVFSLPPNHPQCTDMVPQLSLTDNQSGQAYLITQTDEGDITAQLDLDEFKEKMFIGYTNGSATALATLLQVLPDDWSVTDFSDSSVRRTIEAKGATALEIIKEVTKTYHIAIRFDRKTKKVILHNPDNIAPSGAYFSDELNLRKQPIRTAQTKNFATRLYAVGKDGLTFADINNGKNYVDNNQYSSRIISAYWQDERYTVAESLLEDAKKQLAEMAIPTESYECDIADLAKIDPKTWGHLSVELYQKVILMDRIHKSRLSHQVVRYRRYPHYPTKNIITLSTLPGTISGKVEQSYQAVSSPNSSFRQQLESNLQTVASSITGAKGGYKKDIIDQNGKPSGTLYMDTDNETTAKNIIRINYQGIAFTSHGSGGPWTQAITIDGGLANKWIETWQLTANVIVAGILQSKDGKSFWDLDTGQLNLSGNFAAEDGDFKTQLIDGLLKMLHKNVLQVQIGALDKYGRGTVRTYKGEDKTTFSEQSADNFGVSVDGKAKAIIGADDSQKSGWLGLWSASGDNFIQLQAGDSFSSINFGKSFVAEPVLVKDNTGTRLNVTNAHMSKINSIPIQYVRFNDFAPGYTFLCFENSDMPKKTKEVIQIDNS